MVVIVLGVFVSTALIAISCLLTRKQRLANWIAGISGIGLLLSGLISTQAVLLQCLLTLLVTLATSFPPASRWRECLIGGAALAAIAACVFVIQMGEARNEILAKLRGQYPVVSLVDRLNTENSHEVAGADALETLPPLAPASERQLARLESWLAESFRRDDLRVLHDTTLDKFALAEGFGYLHLGRLEPAPTPGIQIPTREDLEQRYSPPEGGDSPWASDRVNPKPPARATVLSMHYEGLFDFFNPDRMGYFPDREHVVGFKPHAFSATPEIPRDQQPTGSTWHTTRLELVSLLKHDRPLAYVSQNLPRMDELHAAPTRPLGEFETAALEQLRAGEEIVIQDDERGIHMLGAVRAAKDCLVCHTARRGELLGAFSYDLTPIPPRPQRITAEKVNKTVDDAAKEKLYRRAVVRLNEVYLECAFDRC